MKIVHISDIDATALGGGMNTVIPELMRRQTAADDSIRNFLLLVGKKKDTNGRYPFPVIYRSETPLRFLRDADLLVFHSVYNLRFIPYFFYAIAQGIPYVIVSHGGLSRAALRRGRLKKGLFAAIFLNRFVAKAAALCFTSDDEQRNSAYPDHPYIVVPNPISIGDYPPRLNGGGTDPIRVVYLSKIDFYYKGLDMLLDALHSVRDVLAGNVRIDIYGYGNSKEIDVDNIPPGEKDVLRLIEALKELNLASVEYHGPVFGTEKMDILQQSDIYLLTSRSEAMPLSITEALSVGTPCLVSYGTNMGRMIETRGAGWAVVLDKEDIARGLLTAIREYSSDPSRFRRAARALYEENASVDIGRISIAQYKDILNR